MHKVNINIKKSTNLVEGSFDNDIHYSLIKRIPSGGYKQLGNSEARCRDYFLDCVFVDHIYPGIQKNVAIYGYSYIQTGYLKRARRTYLSIALPKIEFPRHEEAAKEIVKFLNFIETDLIGDLKPTRIKKIVEETDGKKRYLLIADPVWKSIGPLLSLYTLLIQVGGQAYSNNCPSPFNLREVDNYLGEQSGRQWRALTKTRLNHEIIPLLIHKRAEIFKTGAVSTLYIPLPHALPPGTMSIIHDRSGIQTLARAATEIKNFSGVSPVIRYYGGDWAKELAKYI